MDRTHALEGTEWVYPNQGDPYGYGLRLRPGDPVDPKVAFFGGVLVQCAFFSREHNAIVVSMGSALLQNCKTHVWEQAREAIISKQHRLWVDLGLGARLAAAGNRSAAAPPRQTL